MKITWRDLDSAIEANVLDPEVGENLWSWLESRQPKSSLGLNVLAYFGALVIISSLTWFVTRAFSEANPAILLVTGFTYSVGFSAVGLILKKRLSSQVPSMLLLTIAVFMVPLTVYALQRVLGLASIENLGSYHDFYTWVNKGWFIMELTTIIVSTIYLIAFKFEFLTFPLAFVLWFLSMDITPLLFGPDFNWDNRKQVSIVFGLGMIAISYVLDLIRKERDYSFWLYLFGLLAFWCAISFSSTDQLILKFLYCGMNLVLIGVAVLFLRPVFLVFGSVGVFMFLYDITNNVFRDSLLFPIYLSLVGVAILVCAILLIKNQKRIDSLLINALPEQIKALIPRR